jgi:hypothetical protein
MKKSLFVLFILLSVSFPVLSQSSYVKLIEKEDFVKAEEKINKALSKEPDDVEANYAMSLLFINTKYPSFNPQKAYDYLLKGIKLFDATKAERDLKNLNKLLINKTVLQNYVDTICRVAMEDAFSKNYVAAFDKYLEIYQNAPASYTKKVIEKRDMGAYKIATTKNTLESYQYFISKYPDALQNADAVQKRNETAFLQAKSVDNISGYKDFIQRYPTAKEFSLALDRVHELVFAQAEKENTSTAYKAFIDEYPISKQYPQAVINYDKRLYVENVRSNDWLSYRSFVEKYPNSSWKISAQDSIYAIGIKTENLDILKYCLENFTGEKRKSALILYHDIFTNDGEKFTLDLFYDKYRDESLSQLRSKDYDLINLFNDLQLNLPFTLENTAKYDQFIRVAAPRAKAFQVLQKMVSVKIEAKDYASAVSLLKTYLPFFGTRNKKLLDLISFFDVK